MLAYIQGNTRNLETSDGGVLKLQSLPDQLPSDTAEGLKDYSDVSTSMQLNIMYNPM